MSNIFVNTVPHSGTHLVTTILDSLGYKHANIKNKFYTVRPYFRRIQKAGINWRSSKELGNYIPLFEKKTVLVSVASPRLVKPSLMTKTFSNVGNKQYIRVVLAKTGTHSNGTPIGAMVVKSHARHSDDNAFTAHNA